jgi:Tfp pilus assembly protein PilX
MKNFKFQNSFFKINNPDKGFVILFAVTLAAILLTITVGVANIAFKELSFGTSARDTNNAFFAADSGIECALLYDRSTPENNIFTGTAPSMNCTGVAVTLTGSAPNWRFVLNNLGTTAKNCAIVTVFKDTVSNAPYTSTQIVSKGYNIGDAGTCTSTNPNRVEREIRINY